MQTDGAVRPRVKTKASHYESSSGRCDFTDDSLGDGASERAPGSPPPVVTDTDSSGGRLTAADCRSPAMSQSRMSISKKSLREITKEQLQQSVVSVSSTWQLQMWHANITLVICCLVA